MSLILGEECWSTPDVMFQKSGPGSLPGASVQGEWTQRALRGGGEHQNHATVLSERPRWDEGGHHEGNKQSSSTLD